MIKKKDYEIIKTFIHMSIVPMSVKKLWFADKNLRNGSTMKVEDKSNIDIPPKKLL